jgi:hypothetical protein
MDLKQNVINKLNLEFGRDVKCIGRSHDIHKTLQEEKSSIEKSVNYDNAAVPGHLCFSNNYDITCGWIALLCLGAGSKGVCFLCELPYL